MPTLTIDVLTSGPHPAAGGLILPPTTSTIVTGPTEAVVVDTPVFERDVAELIARLETSGRSLRTIVITHAHGDHYFGLESLIDRFPDAQAVALPAIAAAAAAAVEDHRQQFRGLFGGAALDNTRVPSAMTGDTLLVDGEELRILELAQADTSPAAMVWIPSLGTAIVGDAAYNGVHPFLAETGPGDRIAWMHSIDTIAALEPRMLVPGHQRLELRDRDPGVVLAETRDYIGEFAQLVDAGADADAVVSAMTARYPDHANPAALVLGAQLAVRSGIVAP